MADHEEDYWDRFARTFDEDQRYITGEAIQKAILKELAEEQNLGQVIEFGCGSGFYTQALAKNSTRIVATDLSDKMLEMAQARLKGIENVTFQKANCESTTFPTEIFDTAVMMNLVQVIKNPLNSFLECSRVLKSGGKLLIASVTGHSVKWFYKAGVSVRFLMKWGKPLPYFRANLSPDQLAPLLRKAAFEVEESKIIGEKTKALYVRARKESQRTA